LLLPDHQWQEKIIPIKGASPIMIQSIGELSIPHHLSGSLARDNKKIYGQSGILFREKQ